MKRSIKVGLVLAMLGILATVAIAASNEKTIPSAKVPYSAIFGTIDQRWKSVHHRFWWRG
jgi:hypothetical protein